MRLRYRLYFCQDSLEGLSTKATSKSRDTCRFLVCQHLMNVCVFDSWNHLALQAVSAVSDGTD